jgi:hypothetical protein
MIENNRICLDDQMGKSHYSSLQIQQSQINRFRLNIFKVYSNRCGDLFVKAKLPYLFRTLPLQKSQFLAQNRSPLNLGGFPRCLR